MCNSSAFSSIGMKRTNCFLAFAALIDHKLWCLLQCCQVIVCTWGFLLQQLMQLQQIVVSPFSITHGKISTLLLNFQIMEIFSLNDIVFFFINSVLALQNLSYPWRSMLKLCIILEFQLVCGSGCCLKQRSQVCGGRFLKLLLSWYCIYTFRSDVWYFS